MWRVSSTKTRGVESLADLEWTGSLEPASLRRALRHALRTSEPALRVIAEDFLSEATAIDLLAVGANGELVSVRIAAEGESAAGAQLLVRGLADTAWLTHRALDLAKLAPELGLLPNAAPRAVLFGLDFDAETISAAQSLSASQIELQRYRCMKTQGQLTLLLEPIKPGSDRIRRALDRSAPKTPPISPIPETRPEPALTDPPSPSAFRTGLSDADLRIEPTTNGSA